ncbi:hypothetical protein GH714_012137 [Hevea brasiliensis]|uniref:Uncharacterized protein n=1 Tax=Hevea brasiliensis TaxID=3981 RepID=A0A6A6LIH1_HEVBR|nr:hypothetical protein GH714_012137 [Hevea brasiliensis]
MEGSLCEEFILADGESLSLSKFDFVRILILTDSPTLQKSQSPDISSEINSEDNNDGVSKDDLLGGDKHNSGDDNLNGKKDDTSYNNSDGINHLENEPSNGDGSHGGSGDN